MHIAKQLIAQQEQRPQRHMDVACAHVLCRDLAHNSAWCAVSVCRFRSIGRVCAQAPGLQHVHLQIIIYAQLGRPNDLPERLRRRF